MQKILSWIRCKDGFRMSVQASETHYSIPREDGKFYTHVEIGYPSSEEESLKEWGDYGGEVFAYVPSGVVFDIIESHGGIRGGQIPPMIEVDEDGKAVKRPLDEEYQGRTLNSPKIPGQFKKTRMGTVEITNNDN
tara:strand:+ start:277 stop:681 length:405 start_codon:yes stop_codon:yes gene_type:complete